MSEQEWRWLLDELHEIAQRKQTLMDGLMASPPGSSQIATLGDELVSLDEGERQLHHALVDALRQRTG